MGLVPPTGGQVRLDGRDLAGERAYRIARVGIAYVPEEREIFANITVDENLRIGMQPARPGAADMDGRSRCLRSSRSSGIVEPLLPACFPAANNRC